MTARKVKPTIVQAQHTAFEERKAIHAAMDELMDKSPSRARLVVAFVSAFCSGVAFGWLAGMVVEYLTVAALVFTGSIFLGTAIWLLSWMLAVYVFIFHMPNVGEWVLAHGPEKTVASIKTTIADKTANARAWFASVHKSSNVTVH